MVTSTPRTSSTRTMAKRSATTARKAATDTQLSRDRIVEAALDQLTTKGLDGFSLREVARTLGVYPTALYWYVRSRNELLSAACELALGSVVPARGHGNWQDWLRELFRRYRIAMKRHPHLAQLVGAQMLSNSSLNIALIEGILVALEEAGCPTDFMVDAYNSIIASMCGFSTLEFAPLPGEDVEAWADALQQRVRQIPALEYPTLARHLPAMANRSFIVRWQSGHDKPLDQSFDAYVDIFISGLERRIADARAAHPAALS